MKAKFTQGSWIVEQEENDKLHISAEGKAEVIATVYSDPLDDEARCNARLISAAPDMLAALIILQKNQEHLINRTPTGEVRNKLTEENIQALAAIQKAID